MSRPPSSSPSTPAEPFDASRSPETGRWLAVIAGGALLLGSAYGLYHGLLAGIATWHTTLAREDLARGEPAEALDRLHHAVAWDPDHSRAQILLAHAEIGHGRLADARARLERRIENGADDIVTLDALARLLEEAGEAERARTLFRRLTSQHPDHLAGPLGLARLGETAPLEARLEQIGPPPAASPIRGVSFFHLDDGFGVTGYGTPASIASLERARRVGANLVSLRVPARQPDAATPTLIFGHEPAGGETDRALERTIRDAHLLGFSILLKPHVMLETITDEAWRGTIAFESEDDLDAWWNDYRRYLLHVAALAERHDVGYLAVGVELRSLVNSSPDQWRALIAEVRAVYSGHLTYAANWFYEFAEVSFWDALDSIGVQFFFPAQTEEATLETLVAELALPARDLAELAYLLERPILLTEVGYRSTTNALAEPWAWPDPTESPDLALQAVAYRAILEIFEEQPWCSGLIWWNWLTTPDPSREFDVDFTPQGKPAESVIRERWSGIRD